MNRRPNIYRSLLLGLVLVVFVGVTGFVLHRIYKEHQTEAQFQQEFGNDWMTHYDQRYGPGSIQLAQTRIMASYVGIPVIALLLLLIYWQATKDRSGGSSRSHRAKKYRQKNEW